MDIVNYIMSFVVAAAVGGSLLLIFVLMGALVAASLGVIGNKLVTMFDEQSLRKKMKTGESGRPATQTR